MTRGQLIWVILLSFAVISSALAVVHSKYSSRQLFVDLQALRQERDAADMEWGRLQLELGTWGTHGRVQRLAHEKLQMRLPRPEEIMIIGQNNGQ